MLVPLTRGREAISKRFLQLRPSEQRSSQSINLRPLRPWVRQLHLLSHVRWLETRCLQTSFQLVLLDR